MWDLQEAAISRSATIQIYLSRWILAVHQQLHKLSVHVYIHIVILGLSGVNMLCLHM